MARILTAGLWLEASYLDELNYVTVLWLQMTVGSLADKALGLENGHRLPCWEHGADQPRQE